MYVMPELNRATILYLARFLNHVVSFSADNKMNTYNIAVIVTPNIFRVKQITSKDLMNHGTLSDVFTLIMGNVDHIINQIELRQNDTSSLTNMVMSCANDP